MEKNNFKKEDAGCDKYGKQRLELAIYLRDNILPFLKKEWFIENGTLLGSWRNGKFIKHDDDFDIGMPIDSLEDIKYIYKIINQKLLNTNYKARIINTYSDKIELYEEEYGKYILLADRYNGADYHYVTLDIQFYLKKKDTYELLYYARPNKKTYNGEILFPTNKIELEGEVFNAPRNVEEFLKQNYGSLDERASYNSVTGLYELK